MMRERTKVIIFLIIFILNKLLFFFPPAGIDKDRFILTWSYVVPLLDSFLIAWTLINPYMKLMRWMKIVGNDIHKKDRPEVPEMGGIVVIASFIFGILVYISIATVVLQSSNNFTELFAVSLSIMSIALIGIFDDMIKKMGMKKGLKQWQKPLMSLAAAIPLMAISAGQSIMAVPILGIINFGFIYPLIIIPLLMVFVSNAINLLAGLNGLESGMTLVACISMLIYGLVFNSPIIVVIMASACGAILLFFTYNKFPAKIFPGDSFTYGVGAIIGATMIVGNMERFGLIILIPWIIEFLLKLSAKFKTECYGEVQEDGTIKCKDKRVSSLTHVVMKLGKFKEWQISAILILFETVICLFAFMVTL